MSTLPSPAEDATLHQANFNLEYHRKQAKALLKELRSGSVGARQRFGALQLPVPEGKAQLADAQRVIARENGFASWPRLKHHADSANANTLRPYVREIGWYEERAEGLVRSYHGGMATAFELIQRHHPGFSAPDGYHPPADFTLEDALLVQARQHGFDSWPEFTTHIEALSKKTAREPFLLAFEAIQSGDTSTLQELLDEHSWLVSARGSNGNSLLNLAQSFWRLDACRMLLGAGANVNQGNNYGWTPLHQAATGSNIPWIEKLLSAGGDLTLSARGEGGTPLVQALFWGNDVMAEALAKRDITPRNLRVAAGLGRLDLLSACFDAKGNLTAEAGEAREFYRPHGEFPEWSPTESRQEILDEAFTYACRNGRTQVLQFLLNHGADIEGDPYRGTGLLWATYKSHWDTMGWLINHGADINQQATFGGRNHGDGVTPLHLAVQEGALEKVRFLVERGAKPDIRDHLFNASPLGWAEFFKHKEVSEYLQKKQKRPA
jgi:ankyrin repeat protein